jgi:hypothetical protein
MSPREYVHVFSHWHSSEYSRRYLSTVPYLVYELGKRKKNI